MAGLKAIRRRRKNATEDAEDREPIKDESRRHAVEQRSGRVCPDKIFGLRDEFVPLVLGVLKSSFGDVAGCTGHLFPVHITVVRIVTAPCAS